MATGDHAYASRMGLKTWGVVERWLWSSRCGESGGLYVSVYDFMCLVLNVLVE